MVDYSSDRLESSDIWDVPGGSFLEQWVAFPRPGQDLVGSGVFMDVEAVTSPSDFLILSPEHLVADPLVKSFSQRLEVLVGSSNRRDTGLFSNQKLGSQASAFLDGFEVLKCVVEEPSEGEAGQVLQGKVSSRDSSEDERRVPLAVAEQRGFETPRKDFLGDGSGDLGDCDGRRVQTGIAKKRRKNWLKKKVVRNYAVGEDLAWDRVMKMAQCSLVGRAVGRNFAQHTIQEWAVGSWGSHLGYSPVVVELNRGWFAVNLEK